MKETKYGEVFKDKTELYNLLKSGEQRIQDVYHQESPRASVKLDNPFFERCLGRKSDSAMAFIPQTEILNSGNIVADSISKIGLLRQLERDLVKENGAMRYKNDEYLNLDYHKLTNVWVENKRQNEAQWFLVSEISKGYGKIVKDLIKHIQEHGQNNKTKKLLDYALKKETEFINRSYARITPKNSVKANGYSCPAYKVPEAYEAISTNTGIKYVPGAHTPLTWAESSLLEASELFMENLNKLSTI